MSHHKFKTNKNKIEKIRKKNQKLLSVCSNEAVNHFGPLKKEPSKAPANVEEQEVLMDLLHDHLAILRRARDFELSGAVLRGA